LNNSKDKRKIALLQWPTLAIALGPSDENGLAHLGLSARYVKTGEFPHSPPGRGLPADSGRPAVSGRGRRCQGASPEGEGPDLGHRRRRGSPWWARGGDASRRWESAMAGRRRCGEHRLGVRGAAVSSGGCRYSDRGARRWLEVALDGRAAPTTKGGGQLGASTVACGEQWLSGWLGMAQRRMRAVRGCRRFSAWSRGVRREQSGHHSTGVAGRGETSSPRGR
jgi:hypothetical protein